MSAIASAFVVSEANLPALVAAAKPVKRLLRKPLDLFPGFLASNAQQLPAFEGSGFLFTTVLVFLQERGIDLLRGPYAAVAEELQQSRGALLCIFLTASQRAEYLSQLMSLSVSPREMEQYFEAFTETRELGVGQILVQAIEYLRKALASVPEAGIVVFNIG